MVNRLTFFIDVTLKSRQDKAAIIAPDDVDICQLMTDIRTLH